MPVTIDKLRALRDRAVTLRTSHGSLHGCIAQADIPPSAIVILFAVAGGDAAPLVVPVDSIDEIEER